MAEYRRSSRTSIVVITRDRCAELCNTLERLAALPERPPIILVDNASGDGTVAMVRARRPEVRVVALRRNRAAAARNVGVALATTPYIAFADDDSWWAPGALDAAADLLDAHSRLAVVAARVLVGSDRHVDPVCERMAQSPLPVDGVPGPRVLGFVACGTIVRRAAFLAVGGFDERFGVGGEESLLATDLAAAGWALHYAPDIVAVHVPSPVRNRTARRRRVIRNELWHAWLRRPVASALRTTTRVAAAATTDRDARHALVDAVAGARIVLQRRAVPPAVESQLRLLERTAS